MLLRRKLFADILEIANLTTKTVDIHRLWQKLSRFGKQFGRKDQTGRKLQCSERIKSLLVSHVTERNISSSTFGITML